MNNYKPMQGDIIELNLNSLEECEKDGNKLALIISNNDFYNKTGLIIICPITNTKNQFPLHIKLSNYNDILTTGTILSQRIITIDPIKREIKFIESVTLDIIENIKKIIKLFF